MPRLLTACFLAAGLLFIPGRFSRAAEANWVNISAPIVDKIKESSKKQPWPEVTAGVAVDPATGDVYMVVTGEGIWKSTDAGKTFERVDGGKISGRCETAFALNFDSSGKRLACFMLDGKCGWTGDAGKTWNSFADAGRNWDFAAVDWSTDTVQHIFAGHHETGGEVMYSADGGRTWTKLFKEKEFDRTGGLGIFDQKTLVYTQKGSGIQRSTDAGKNWTKVAEQEPIGRAVNVFEGKAYWLGKEGLLVSADKGSTWTVQGKPVNASIGPYFDAKNAKRIVVAGTKGIFKSNDGGETWQIVATLPAGLEKLPKAGWYTNVAWDPVRDIYYASLMGKHTFRLEGAK